MAEINLGFNRSGAIVWILTFERSLRGNKKHVGFNRSGAIVWILTDCGFSGHIVLSAFQSLRRDSLDSYLWHVGVRTSVRFVSIAQAR